MSEQFEIMRIIEIDAAHRVPEHGSKCRALHGHRYRIEAYCRGSLATEGQEDGMVLDFSFLKDGMMRLIHDPCDHGLIVRYNDPLLLSLDPEFAAIARDQIGAGSHSWEGSDWSKGLKLYAIPVVPTAENLARHWFTRLAPFVANRSSGRATLSRIKVHETPNCVATYPSE